MAAEPLPDLLDAVTSLKRELVSRATNEPSDDQEYRRLRKLVLSTPTLAPNVPKFVRQCQTIGDFWQFIQPMFPTYRERKDFLAKEFEKLFEGAEFETIPSGHTLELGELIGSGGFGEVYRVHHELLNMDFAVKLFSPVYRDPEDRDLERFFREARILFTLNHPNVIRIHDAGLYTHRPFIRMELFEGRNLNQMMIEDGRCTHEKALQVVCAIAEGLRHAHDEARVVHRDLKPSNVMIDAIGRVRILDFGLGVFLENDIVSRVTKTGESAVGGYYTAPELLQEPKLLDPRTDIYSLGAIWFTLLCGRPPAGAGIERILEGESAASGAHRAILLRCLAASTERFSSASTLLGAIRGIEGA